jgi:DNA polymerase III subunit epsilon
MYLFVDTETSGLSRASSRSVQIAWILSNKHGHVLTEESHIIRPVGFEIEIGAQRVHGISKARAMQVGVDIVDVLKSFKRSLDKSVVLVGHNIQYDVAILQNDIRVSGLDFSLINIPNICTMKASTNWCRLSKLNGASGFKFPTLNELNFRCFGEQFDGAHDALNDIRATKRCFFKLIDHDVIAPYSVENQSRGDATPLSKTAAAKTENGFPKGKTNSRCSKKNVQIEFNALNSNVGRFTRTMAVNGACQKCGTRFSVTLSRGESSARCPECFSSVIFKGNW